jgi:chemotaxis protein methyltransferase CheR
VIRLREEEFSDIVNYMREEYGINLDKKKVLIECRMTKLLEKRGLNSFGKYLDMLHQDRTGDMAAEMVNCLTTNYTYFYREPDHFRLLQERILPKLMERRQYGGLDIWSAGCSTGEECYTLAMVLEECRRPNKYMGNIRLLATDISGDALDKAQKGQYPAKELEKLPLEWQKKYCAQVDDRTFQVNEELRYRIRFEKRNLLEPRPSTERFDLILCRNVMIYFDRDARMRLVRMLEDALNPGGYLMIGHAELLTAGETVLESVYPAVYRKEQPADK